MENMYKVGDYVYFETSSTSPFQIRRIEELNKTPNGHVEAKVMCFYRRRDISSSLIMLADKHQSLLEENGETVPEEKEEEQSEKGSHQLKHRELFLSRQVETLPATHIRGKCVVTLLNETEALTSYLNKEDMFFYSLVYDPQQKTLLADKGEIRVGSKYQAEITSLLEGEDTRKLSELEDLIWQPCPENGITDKEIDQFQIVAKSVGTFARALDCTSTVRQPSLHMSAAAASRDISLFNAMHTLHEYKYNIANAVTSLVPDGGPVLCKDEMEEWSASEANLFEEALDKYGKDFNDIRQDFLPWKSLKSIIEYYYMWKTTDRYVQQKRIKAAEAERKLKQVYIPNQKPNPAHPAVLSGKMNGDQMSGRACESCYSSHSNLWYAWGPSHLQCRLCSSCWTYWKKYGGLKMPTRLDGERPAPNQRQGQFTFSDRGNAMNIMRTHRCTIAGCGKEFKLKTHLARHLATAHGLAIRPGSPKPVMKTRTAFCLVTTALTRLSRRLCKDLLRPKHAARLPFIPINIAAIKQECQLRLEERGNYVPNIKYRVNLSLEPVLARLGIDITQEKPHLLGRHGTKGKPNERVNNTSSVNSGHPSIMRRRGYEQSNGVDNGPPSKIQRVGGVNLPRVPLRVPVPMRNSVLLGVGMNRRNKVRVAKGTRTPMISWIDDPDDVYFVATDATRKLRRKVSQSDHKRAGRNPWKRLLLKPALKVEKEVVTLE